MSDSLVSESCLSDSHPGSFVHLHMHTQYSLLDGAIRLKDLFKKCQDSGMPAVAMTDHGNMFGTMDFYTSAKKAGVKPIIGCEVYFTPGSRFDRGMARRNVESLDSQDAEESKHMIHHLVLLCKNNIGYSNLCQLVSKANMEGFYYKPRIDLEILEEYSEGLIATSACLKGEVGWNFYVDQDTKAIEAIERLKGIFGEDFYLEIQENGLEEQQKINKKIIEYARANDLPLVATNDCHYLDEDDATAQEVLLCIQTGKTFLDEKRMKLSTTEFYVKTPEQMRKAFHYAPDACDNTLKIADKCQVDFCWTDADGNPIYYLPDFKIDTGESSAGYFARLAKEGLQKRFNGPHFTKLVKEDDWESVQKPVYLERLEYEIQMIQKMEFPGYFLIVSDFIKWAKERGIPVGPGRGSGAGSLVAYSLDITNINPIPFNLLFERFINPERISMPDFDVDFCQDGRQEVLDYVSDKYGEEKVGQIITFGQLLAKGVIRDVSRVYGLPYSEADYLAKLIPDELKMTLSRALEMEPRLKELEDKDPKVRQVLKIAKRLEGLFKSAGMHACGVIITNDPLVNHCPLFKGKEGERVVQYDKNWSEEIGLVKFDFLGLKTLTVIRNAGNFIRRDLNPDFDIEYVDLEDKKVFDYVSTGNTLGVFQLESSGMQDLCKRIKPDCLDDVTAINALYRPGPLGSGMVDDFIERKQGLQDVSYPFKELEGVLQDTYGIVVYQEQVMNIARTIAGYSLGQADMLRKAMGKKKVSEMERHREIYREGAEKNGFDVKIALDLYDLMAKFAEYGFNKSHAVAYAYIAYQTAYLKCYHPGAFFASLLSTEMSNTDKITLYSADAKRIGLNILPPDINESLWLFNVLGENIRFGMGAIKNVGENAVAEIIREREEEGNYTGFINFCERIDFKIVNKRVVESLIKVGAFDLCDLFNRKTLLENMEMIISYAQKFQQEKLLGQGNLFDVGLAEGEESTGNKLDIAEVPDFDDRDKLGYESDLMGIYVSGHPLDRYQDILKQMASMEISLVQEQEMVAGAASGNEVRKFGKDRDKNDPNRREMTLGGMITALKPFITKTGNRMAFATLEDLTGKIECVIFNKTYEKYEAILAEDEPLIITGRVNLAEDPKKFFPEKIQKLKESAEERVSGVRVSIEVEGLNNMSLERLKQLFLANRGSVPIHIIMETTKGRARMPLGEEFYVNPTPQMAAKINELLQRNSVKFIIDGKLEEAIN